MTIGSIIRGPAPTIADLEEIRAEAKSKNAIFVKIEPNLTFKEKAKAQKTIKLLQESGCIRGKTLFTPQSFWLDLTKDEDTLLNLFIPKTRYNIRYAQRKGVQIKEDNSPKAFENIWN